MLAAALVTGGVVTAPAFAYFTATGSGSASGATGALQPLTILSATTGSPSSGLQPGGTGDLLLNVTNPNSSAVTITGVSQGGGVTVVGGSGCTSDSAWPTTLGNSGVTVATTTGLSVVVAGGATATVHVSSGAAMSTSSVSGCQGASFRVPVTVVVSQ
ncbi:MAG: hypothetical protein U0R80_11090 [Nocardioidaceae bacterium]